MKSTLQKNLEMGRRSYERTTQILQLPQQRIFLGVFFSQRTKQIIHTCAILQSGLNKQKILCAYLRFLLKSFNFEKRNVKVAYVFISLLIQRCKHW